MDQNRYVPDTVPSLQKKWKFIRVQDFCLSHVYNNGSRGFTLEFVRLSGSTTELLNPILHFIRPQGNSYLVI